MQKICPRHDLGMLLEETPALAFGHAAPDAELNPIVERLRRARLHHWAVAANHRSPTLRGPSRKECVGIRFPAQCLREPSVIIRVACAPIVVDGHKTYWPPGRRRF